VSARTGSFFLFVQVSKLKLWLARPQGGHGLTVSTVVLIKKDCVLNTEVVTFRNQYINQALMPVR